MPPRNKPALPNENAYCETLLYLLGKQIVEPGRAYSPPGDAALIINGIPIKGIVERMGRVLPTTREDVIYAMRRLHELGLIEKHPVEAGQEWRGRSRASKVSLTMKGVVTYTMAYCHATEEEEES